MLWILFAFARAQGITAPSGWRSAQGTGHHFNPAQGVEGAVSSTGTYFGSSYFPSVAGGGYFGSSYF